MYFFPAKVNSQKDRILRKKEELILYQQIIENSLKYLEDKIHENEDKQHLVKDMND